jgi:hypothetical protein
VSTLSATTITVVLLFAAGLLPTLALVGWQWITVTLAPLGGAVVASLAATGFVAVGGTFLEWFVGLAVVAAALVVVLWWVKPHRRPTRRRSDLDGRALVGYRVAGIVGAIGVLGMCIWSLRGLSSPTVGFDARAVWLLRPGWLLEPHHQILANFRDPFFAVPQDTYPPLVSAAVAVGWGSTGDHSLRLGVVVVAVLNTCAVATAAFALVECGRRLVERGHRAAGERPGLTSPVGLAPLVVGVVAAALLVPIAFGITEPFITNGYADPIWSLAAVGAVAYGLQMGQGRAEAGTALILVLVAGLSKNEGVVTAAALILLMAVRGLVTLSAEERRRGWWRPVLLGGGELAVVAAWPLVMRGIHAGSQSTALSGPGAMVSRAHATVDGMAPYLHSLLWAAPIAVVGGLALSGIRRRGGIANDGWAWAGTACGLLAVAGALITGTGAIAPWLVSTVHRVTEFPAMMGWWIVATWAVVASGVGQPAPVQPAVPGADRSADDRPDDRPGGDRPGGDRPADG